MADSTPTPDSTSTPRTFYGILVAGLVYRAFYLWELSRLPDWSRLIGDEAYFMDQARHFGEPGPCEPFHMSPLFIVGLSYFRRLFGENPLCWRLFLIACGALSAVLLAATARRLLGAALAPVALGLYLFCGPLIYYESNLDLCTLASTTTVAALYFAVRWQHEDRVRDYLLAGLCVGIGILARPNAALLCGALFLGPLFLRPGKPWPRRLALAVAAPLLALLCTIPVSLHNRSCDPDPVWVTDSGGLNLYIGNHRGANGTFNIPDHVPGAINVATQQAAFQAAAARALGQPRVSPARASAYWSRAAIKEIQADPGAWLRLMARKVALVFNAQDLSNTRSYEFRSELCLTLGPWLVQVGYLAPLALIGLVLGIARPRQDFFVVLFTLAFTAALSLFFVLGHYRQVLLPLFILLALRTGQTLWSLRAPRAARPRLLLGLLAIVVLAIPTNRPVLDVSSRADDIFKHAFALHISGDLAGAERWYLESLAETPTLQSARNLALLYTSQGRRPEAARLWSLVRRLARAEGAPEIVTEAERYLGALRPAPPPPASPGAPSPPAATSGDLR